MPAWNNWNSGKKDWIASQQRFTCSNSAIKTLEIVVKYVQS